MEQIFNFFVYEKLGRLIIAVAVLLMAFIAITLGIIGKPGARPRREPTTPSQGYTLFNATLAFLSLLSTSAGVGCFVALLLPDSTQITAKIGAIFIVVAFVLGTIAKCNEQRMTEISNDKE